MIDLAQLRRSAKPRPAPAVVSRAWLAQVADELDEGRRAADELARLRRERRS